MAASLTDKQLEVLSRVAKRGAAQGKDFKEFGFKTPQILTNYLLEFHRTGLVEREEHGRESRYNPRGDVTVYCDPGYRR